MLAKRCSRNSRQARSISRDCESEPVDALAVLDALDLLALLHDPFKFIAIAQSLRCQDQAAIVCHGDSEANRCLGITETSGR